MRTTIARPNALPAPDLVERRFEQQSLDALWVGDVTYIPTGEGWLYLATVLDACSRRLLGWSIAEHLRTELCLDALEAAVGCRGGKGHVGSVVFHSDKALPVHGRGHQAICSGLGISQSMGSVGDSQGNAMAESFFAGLKREAVDGEHFATKAEARAAVFEWIIWHNATRLHSALD